MVICLKVCQLGKLKHDLDVFLERVLVGGIALVLLVWCPGFVGLLCLSLYVRD
jgi:hypothetical protein